MRTIGKILKKMLLGIVCLVIFVTVFGISLMVKLSALTEIDLNSFTLQKEASDEVRYTGEIERSTLHISYITNEGNLEERDIVVLRPAGHEEDIPIIYIPHYSIEENTADFQQYMSHGWAVASPVFRNEYNGILTGDDLVFNNAALYTLRHLDGIDRQRIAIVGGSAGGYMSLMLNELQMGTCASIANSPIANVYYNLQIYFKACDELNRNSEFADITMPIQLLVSKSFRGNLSNFPDIVDADRWAQLSPIGNVKSISNPVVVNHYTGDILVPVDQITKKYTYKKRNKLFTEDFPIMMLTDYPGILSRSLEEEADPEEVAVRKYDVENKQGNIEMPVSSRLLTVNIFDDGPMDPKGSHTAPGTTGSLDIIPYLEKMFEKGLQSTEKAVPEKLLLLINRYRGESIQLPVHEGINDEVYGSLAVYRQEIVEELQQYADSHSLNELEAAVSEAIKLSDNEGQTSKTWQDIRSRIHE